MREEYLAGPNHEAMIRISKEKCKFFELVDAVHEDKNIVTIKNLQDLDNFADTLRKRMKTGPVKVQIKCNS